jgi:hypothetical protein
MLPRVNQLLCSWWAAADKVRMGARKGSAAPIRADVESEFWKAKVRGQLDPDSHTRDAVHASFSFQKPVSELMRV